MNRESEIGKKIGDLCHEKSKAYGDSISGSADIMRVLYPDGIPVEHYTNALILVRIIDKLMRIANNEHAFGEEPWKDITGYCIRRIEADEREADSYDPDKEEDWKEWLIHH